MSVNPRLVLAATILGSGIVFLDGSVVNVALPAIRDDLDTGLAAQQWIVEAYLLTLGALLLVGGAAGDLYGRRRIFLLGLSGFAATSLACAVAPNAELLVAARALQGVAGALLVPSSLAIIQACFPPAERAAAIGTWTAWTGIFFVMGPLGGGTLVDHASWRWIFLINVPLVALNIVLVRRAVPETAAQSAPPRLDFFGAALCALGLAGPVFALIEQPLYGWGDGRVGIPLALGTLLLAAFVGWERRAPHPMLPLEIFRSRNFAVGNLATLAIYGGQGTATFFIVIYLQQVAGYGAVAAGAALLPITGVMLVLARRFGALAARVGPRLFMGGGPLVAACGFALLSGTGADVDYVTDVLPAVLVFGLGLSLTVAPLTATVLGAVPEEHAGVASGTSNAISRIAALLAIAAVGAVLAARFSSALDERVDALRPPPSAAERAAALRAKDRSLARRVDGAPRLQEAVTDASVDAFHAGILAAALLVAAGGLTALAGIENPRAEPLPE